MKFSWEYADLPRAFITIVYGKFGGKPSELWGIKNRELKTKAVKELRRLPPALAVNLKSPKYRNSEAGGAFRISSSLMSSVIVDTF